jgi:hypothetical protein
MIPDFIQQITDTRLRDYFIQVWFKLPAYARLALDTDRPRIFLVDEIPGGHRARVGLAINRQTRQTFLHMHVTRGLLDCPAPQVRGTLAHELAHIYLRHFDHLLTDQAEPPEEVQKWHEWHADFVVINLWGFRDDWEALGNG